MEQTTEPITYYQKNKNRILAASRQYYIDNYDRVYSYRQQYFKAYYTINKDRISARTKKYSVAYRLKKKKRKQLKILPMKKKKVPRVQKKVYPKNNVFEDVQFDDATGEIIMELLI